MPGGSGMYDAIADVYHLIYPDWDEAISTQASALDDLLRTVVEPRSSVLDVSCGIGTQALGLAALGYDVTASDLSSGAVARARREADRRGLEVAFSVIDMRDCHRYHGGGFDVVLTADNSLPHLAGDDLVDAVEAFLECLRPGGVVVIGLRDYRADEDRASPQVWSYGFRNQGDEQFYVFQTRHWSADCYDVAMYFVREETADSSAKVIAGRSRYYALPVSRLMTLLDDVGFGDVRRLDGLLYQPLVVARRPPERA